MNTSRTCHLRAVVSGEKSPPALKTSLRLIPQSTVSWPRAKTGQEVGPFYIVLFSCCPNNMYQIDLIQSLVQILKKKKSFCFRCKVYIQCWMLIKVQPGSLNMSSSFHFHFSLFVKVELTRVINRGWQDGTVGKDTYCHA